MSHPTLSIVVPVYRSQGMLKSLYQRTRDALHEIPFELILVEDCGGDDSWSVIRELAEQDDRVKGFQLSRNFGQGCATLCGIERATGTFVVTMDDDLQHRPEDLPKLLAAMEEDESVDVIMGKPAASKAHSAARNLGSGFLNWVNTVIFSQDRELVLTSFRMMRRPIAETMLMVNSPFPAPGPIICSITQRIKNIEVDHQPRGEGRGGYTLRKICSLTISRIISFSNLPLRILATLGILGILLCLSLIAVYGIMWLRGDVGKSVPGWLSTMLVIISTSSFNFFAFGLIGEYLYRIMQGVHHAPRYLVRDQVNENHD